MYSYTAHTLNPIACSLSRVGRRFPIAQAPDDCGVRHYIFASNWLSQSLAFEQRRTAAIVSRPICYSLLRRAYFSQDRCSRSERRLSAKLYDAAAARKVVPPAIIARCARRFVDWRRSLARRTGICVHSVVCRRERQAEQRVEGVVSSRMGSELSP